MGGKSVNKEPLFVEATALLIPSYQDSDDFADLIDHYIRHVPTFAPTCWGAEEPLVIPYQPVRRRAFLRKGSQDLMWRRVGKGAGEGRFQRQVRAIQGNQHAFHWFSVCSYSASDVDEIIRYLQLLSQAMGTEYAFCDSLVDAYKPQAVRNGFAPHGLLNIFTHRLRRCMPDIAWGQIFGPAYVALFGMEKLLSVPAYLVKEISPTSVYIQLSPSLYDVRHDYAAVEEARQAVKAHLDDNVFFDPRHPPDHVYRTPRFQFSR